MRGISQVSQDGGDLSTPSTMWFLLNFHPSIPLTILFFIHLNCKRKKRKTTGTIFLILRGGWVEIGGIWDERDLVTSCCARAWYCGYFFHHGGKEINEGERRLRSRTDRSTVQPDEAGM